MKLFKLLGGFLFVVYSSCYKLDITVEDEDFQEQSRFEVIDKELAPFDTTPETNTDTRDFLWGPVVSGYFGNARQKRSLPNDEVCLQKDDIAEETSNIVVVEKGETFHLPCHACTDKAGVKFESLQWIKLSPFPNSKGLYHLKEVLSGLHDDDRRNRVIINLDHTLVKKKAKRKDVGSYLCTRNVTRILNERITWQELQRWMTEEVRLRFYFHVDVLDVLHSKVVDVSNDTELKPATIESIPTLNLAVYTSWYSWGECTVCGDKGLRKRVGICTVRKLYKEIKLQYGYLESILKQAVNGLPCQSELLKQLHEQKPLQRPNEVQIEECLVPCATTASNRRRRSISKSELLSGEKKDEGKSKDVKLRDGDSLIMVCPGSSLASLAVWINGSENIPLMELKKKTNNRISYDPLGNMIFSPVKLEDAGVYSCWLKKKMKRKFDVKVTVNNAGEAIHYSAYLGYVFLADFGVFVVLSVIKFMNRRVQLRRRKTPATEQKLLEESSSDENSEVSGDSSSDSSDSSSL